MKQWKLFWLANLNKKKFQRENKNLDTKYFGGCESKFKKKCKRIIYVTRHREKTVKQINFLSYFVDFKSLITVGFPFPIWIFYDFQPINKQKYGFALYCSLIVVCFAYFRESSYFDSSITSPFFVLAAIVRDAVAVVVLWFSLVLILLVVNLCCGILAVCGKAVVTLFVFIVSNRRIGSKNFLCKFFVCFHPAPNGISNELLSLEKHAIEWAFGL